MSGDAYDASAQTDVTHSLICEADCRVLGTEAVVMSAEKVKGFSGGILEAFSETGCCARSGKVRGSQVLSIEASRQWAV